jgi:hypothetical protein
MDDWSKWSFSSHYVGTVPDGPPLVSNVKTRVSWPILNRAIWTGPLISNVKTRVNWPKDALSRAVPNTKAFCDGD